MKTIVTGILLLLSMSRPAQPDFVQVFNAGRTGGIPDGSLAGRSDTRNLVGAPAGMKEVSVTLNLTGGWNGDSAPIWSKTAGSACC